MQAPTKLEHMNTCNLGHILQKIPKYNATPTFPCTTSGLQKGPNYTDFSTHKISELHSHHSCKTPE